MQNQYDHHQKGNCLAAIAMAQSPRELFRGARQIHWEMGCRNKASKEQNKVLVEVDTAEEAAMAYDTAADTHQGTKDSHNHHIH